MSEICGGIIKESEFWKRMEKDMLEEVMMAFVMPDKHFEKYQKLKKQGKYEKAEKVFKKYAWSII